MKYFPERLITVALVCGTLAPSALYWQLQLYAFTPVLFFMCDDVSSASECHARLSRILAAPALTLCAFMACVVLSAVGWRWARMLAAACLCAVSWYYTAPLWVVQHMPKTALEQQTELLTEFKPVETWASSDGWAVILGRSYMSSQLECLLWTATKDATAGRTTLLGFTRHDGAWAAFIAGSAHQRIRNDQISIQIDDRQENLYPVTVSAEISSVYSVQADIPEDDAKNLPDLLSFGWNLRFEHQKDIYAAPLQGVSLALTWMRICMASAQEIQAHPKTAPPLTLAPR